MRPRPACRTRIAVITPYFGPLPTWIDDFIETCKYNRTVDWFLFTDSKPPANSAENVKVGRITFDDFKARVNERLQLRCSMDTGYKIGDFRPAFGILFEELIPDYDF